MKESSVLLKLTAWLASASVNKVLQQILWTLSLNTHTDIQMPFLHSFFTQSFWYLRSPLRSQHWTCKVVTNTICLQLFQFIFKAVLCPHYNIPQFSLRAPLGTQSPFQRIRTLYMSKSCPVLRSSQPGSGAALPAAGTQPQSRAWGSPQEQEQRGEDALQPLFA